MSILDVRFSGGKIVGRDGEPIKNALVDEPVYNPDDAERNALATVIRAFTDGYVTMNKPRVEFNDMSVLTRYQVDKMSWNTYQPNDGDGVDVDPSQAWKSNIVRPVARNKAVSIAAHTTARLIFPKVFAENSSSEIDEDSAEVMRDLMEWGAERSNYSQTSLFSVIAALYSPASLVHTEYVEAYANRRDPETHELKQVLDEENCGFTDTVVPVDEMYIENFYQNDIQKQGFIIWRRVQSYSMMQSKYGHLDNFKYVKPGVQNIFNDANQSFYPVYDPNMRDNLCEEIMFWSKQLDLYLILVNGVLMTSPTNPNPREDKLYPFAKFGYELIDEGRCFYYKSLVFKMQGDTRVINTLYSMIVDGTYLNIMPPMINVGGQAITSAVIVPGAVTNLDDPAGDLKSVEVSKNLAVGMNTLMKMEEGLSQDSQDPILQGQNQGGTQTAYEISQQEQNAQTVLGLFIKMIGEGLVKGYGKLRMGDILQYLTLAEIDSIVDDTQLIYKTFLVGGESGKGNRRIKFENIQTGNMSADQLLMESIKTMIAQGGPDSDTTLARVNPTLFRDLKYRLVISPDVMNPMSEAVERAFGLEEYDRMIQHPEMYDPEKTALLLLTSYPKTQKQPKEYLAPNIGQPAMPQGQPQPQGGSLQTTQVPTPVGTRPVA